MRFHRRAGRPARASRLFTFLVLPLFVGVLCARALPLAAAGDASGQVVDTSGRPLPRAYVRVFADTGRAGSGAFTSETGEFALDAPVAPSSGCRVEAALTGFETASVPCAAGGLRIELRVAPVRETVFVTGTRTPTPTSQAGTSLTVFTAEDLERRATPLLADLLAGTPGAMVMRSGGPGTVTSLYVRGGESDYNKVLLDGVPLNEPGGSFYLNNLSTENLERVEIVRGAYSSLFGSDAMASVVQLFTRRPDRAARSPQVSAQVDGGTYGTTHASAAVNGATGRLDYSLGGARLDSDNRVPNSALENTTFSANVGVALGRSATLRVLGRAEREHVGTPGTTAYGPADTDAFFDRRDGIGSVSVDQQVNRALRQRAAYSLASSYQQSTDLLADGDYTAKYLGRVGLFPSSDFTSDTSNDLRRHHAGYQADIQLAGRHTLTLLADWDGERAASTDRRTGATTTHARDNAGVSFQQQMLWRRVFATAGGRVEHNGGSGTAFAPRGTIVLVVHEPSAAAGETSIRASAGTGVKEPTLLESFSVSPYFRGNPNLDPERSRSAEVGIEQRLFADRAKIGAMYFDNRFRDVIQLVTTNPATYEGQYFNAGATRARGIEFGAEIAPVRALRAQVGYTRLDGKVLESAVPYDTVFALGAELFRRPRNSGSLGVSLDWQRISADLHGVFVGRFADSDFGLFFPSFTESPGHNVWDARAAVRLTRQVTVLLGVDNLTNTDYSEPLGYQPLLRAVRAGFRVRF